MSTIRSGGRGTAAAANFESVDALLVELADPLAHGGGVEVDHRLHLGGGPTLVREPDDAQALAKCRFLLRIVHVAEDLNAFAVFQHSQTNGHMATSSCILL